MSNEQKISDRVKKLRGRRSQEEFARELGFSRNYLSMIENGREPGADFLESLERAEGLVRSEHQLAPSTPRGRLAAALASRRLTPAQLAKLIRHDAGVIHAVVNGTARASERMIEAITRELPELSKEELMDGGDQPMVLREDGMEGTYGAKPQVALPPGLHGRLVPLLSMAQAGGWDADHSDEGWAGEAVFALNVDDRRAFAIRVSGNSMEPEIREGDVVICSPRGSLSPGAAAVVRTRSGQAFVKFWRKHGESVVLESANPDYKAIHFPLAEIAGAWPVVQTISSRKIQKNTP